MGSGGARVPWPSSRFIPRIPSEFAGAAKNAVRTTIFAAAMEQFARRIRSSCSEKTGLSGCRSGRVQLGPATVTARAAEATWIFSDNGNERRYRKLYCHDSVWLMAGIKRGELTTQQPYSANAGWLASCENPRWQTGSGPKKSSRKKIRT